MVFNVHPENPKVFNVHPENPNIAKSGMTHQALVTKVLYVAGGATQNTIRVAQWMLQVEGAGESVTRRFG